MKKTYLKAKALFIDGKIDEAWMVDQQDEGLLSGITKNQWIKSMNDIIGKTALDDYWAGSISSSVIHDYKTGNIKTTVL